MSLEIGRFTPTLHLVAAARPPLATRADAATGGPEAVSTMKRTQDIPPTPPADVRAQVDEAARRAAELAANGRELHFEKDADTGRIIIQVRELDGRVIRTIPPSHALAFLTGTL